MSAMRKHPFTVVGYAIIHYDGAGWIQYESWCEWTWAADAIQASEQASARVIDRALQEDSATDADTVTCAVLAGHHENLPFDS